MLYFVEFSNPVNDYFEASSISFGMGFSGLAGGGVRTAQRNPIEFTKGRDSLSAALLRHCAMGTVFGTVWVEFYRDADSDVYVTYTLSDAIIGSLSLSDNGESGSLNYTTVKADYFGR